MTIDPLHETTGSTHQLHPCLIGKLEENQQNGYIFKRFAGSLQSITGAIDGLNRLSHEVDLLSRGWGDSSSNFATM